MWETLEWNTIDCFIRPQAHLVEHITGNSADSFLFLLSFIRAHGLNGNFCSSEKGHFFFLQNAIPSLLGINFIIERCDDPAGAQASVEAAQANQHPVLVPGCPRTYGGGDGSDPVDGHYYLVLRREGSDFVILDSAACAPYGRQTTYNEFRLSRPELGRLVSSLFKYQRSRQAYSVLREPGLWTLRAQLGSPTSLRAACLSSLLRCLLDGSNWCSGISFDLRNLRRVVAAFGDSREHREFLVKSYLKEANLCSVYLTLLAQEVSHANPLAGSRLLALVTDYLSAAKVQRDRFAVAALTQPRAVNPESLERWFEQERLYLLERMGPSLEVA